MPRLYCPSRENQTLDALVRHISHIAAVGGIDCLCLGSDLDGITALPSGMEDVREMSQLPGLLEAAGFSPTEIEAICAANLIRFLRENLE
jgi:membrane dipeptidase